MCVTQRVFAPRWQASLGCGLPAFQSGVSPPSRLLDLTLMKKSLLPSIFPDAPSFSSRFSFEPNGRSVSLTFHLKTSMPLGIRILCHWEIICTRTFAVIPRSPIPSVISRLSAYERCVFHGNSSFNKRCVLLMVVAFAFISDHAERGAAIQCEQKVYDYHHMSSLNSTRRRLVIFPKGLKSCLSSCAIIDIPFSFIIDSYILHTSQ